MRKFDFVLLIDDDPIANFLTERLLTKIEVSERIETASNGHEAFDIIEDHCSKGNSCPDLLLLDINMPVMSGIDFLKLFKEKNYQDSEKAVLVVLSTTTSNRDHKEIMSYGVKHILQKPLTEAKLQQVWEEPEPGS